MKSVVHRLLPLFLLLSFFMHSTDALDATTDKQALLYFKSVVHDPQNALSGWNHSSPLCTWFGISCTTNGTRVRALSLPALGLSGTIPTHLSNLTFLETLDLSKNSFRGPLLLQFGRLRLLRHLILDENSITGEIPESLSHCFNLEELSFPFNNLTGNLSPQLGSLSRLKVLKLSKNNLTGTIPPSFGNLSSLIDLGLAGNQLVGRIPNELGRLPGLLRLQLSENHLTGEIPHSIHKISSLEFFSVTENELSGKLPPDFGLALPNLKQIFQGQNNLQGPIPSSISNASRIQTLDLSSNRFEGEIPLLGSMKHLVKLNLGANRITSTTSLNHRWIGSLTNAPDLEVIIMNSNRLAGELPSSIANLSIHLSELCLDDNLLSGSFPQGLDKYRNLTVLSLYQNSFEGELPKSIGMLHKLQRLSLYQNMLSGEIPDCFGNLSQLYELRMGMNQFSGRIPKSIGLCKHLHILGLSQNSLTGSIPKEIFGLSDLSNLLLSQNALNGSLPIEISGLKQVSSMDVSDNLLSGNIPSTIEACLSLEDLSMARNRLSGPIPESIGKLKGLESLDLSSNNLSGPIPEDLKGLHVLKKLNLSFNEFEGPVPEGLFMNFSLGSLQGNQKLCSGDQNVTVKMRIPLCKTKREKNRSISPKVIVIVVISAVLVFVSFCVTWVLIIKIRKKNKKDKGSSSSHSLIGQLMKISYNEISSATNGFAAENLIGRGSFGSVYKGVFNSGVQDTNNSEHGASSIVAIKVLDLKQSKALQSFTLECEALRNIRHRNLVKIITSCSSINQEGADFKALVMEFMPNGSLDKWLYPEDVESGSSLNLIQRLNISINVASAVDYLHHDCDPPVVHCDLKPGNILLDDNMDAHVGDFGLARLLSQNPSQGQSSTIGLRGSIGYIAPEYSYGGKASTSGDVYSFGILLLEVFLGRKPTDEMFNDGLDLKKFASTICMNQAREIVDQSLFGDSTSSSTDHSSSNSSITINDWESRRKKCLEALIRAGLSCAAASPNERLTMRETLKELLAIKKALFEM